MARRVVIADDSADLLAILGARLRSLGFEVHEAPNGARALEAVKLQRPDAAILDVMMPELNGFQVCRRMKQDPELAKIPVILLTGKDTDADRFWGGEVGADLYLAKPMDAARVAERLSELLQAK